MHATAEAWKVLLVDDDPSILRLGELLLSSVEFDGRKVSLLQARSAEDAKQVFRENLDIAVAIVDVIMETESAGLDLAVWISKQETHAATRVVVHSGQPADTRQDAVERIYEIHDYWHKSAVNVRAMRSRLLFQLRNYRDITRFMATPRCAEPDTQGVLSTVVYASTWVGRPGVESLRALVASSRERNRAADITGALLVDGQRILQVLEGPTDAVTSLWQRIRVDDRHQDVEALHVGAIHARSFANWSMRTFTASEVHSSVATPLFEAIRAYASGYRPTVGHFAQLLLSLIELSGTERDQA
jgi:CheY-like chemotaxis protein